MHDTPGPPGLPVRVREWFANGLRKIIGEPAAVPFEKRLFRAVNLASTAALLIAFPLNLWNELDAALLLVNGLGLLLVLTMLLLSLRPGPLLVLRCFFMGSAMIVVGLLWILTAGIEGSTTLVAVLVYLILLSVFDGRHHLRVSLIYIAYCLGLIGLSVYHPGHITPYPSAAARQGDLAFGLVATLLICGLMLSLLRRTYEIERTAVAQKNAELKAQTEQLLEARDATERAANARVDFLSVVSHELRTPLNSVIGMTDLLQSENPRPDQLEYLKILKFSSQNLFALINDVLDYSKLEAGTIDFENIDFDLRDLLESIRAAMSMRASDRGLDLTLRVDPAVPHYVRGDPTRLTQILLNLLGNAVKFTEKGTVTLEVHASTANDRVRLFFSITDTGIGIPADRIDSIFDKFTQAGPEISRRFGGTGLGLTITRRLLQLQGGEISVDSVPGQGSRFNFTLEFAPGAGQAHVADAAVQPGADLRGRQVLLVEDFEPNVILARRYLEKWGLHVDHAANGRVGVELAQSRDYQLILMDVQMPELDGIAAALAIRALPDEYRARVPILALTAAALPEERERAMSAGMNDYLSKPFQPDALLARITRHIRTTRLPPEDSAT